MKKIKNSIIIILTIGSILILQGCYTQMESTKKVKVVKQPTYETRTYTYIQPVVDDSLVYYQDENGNVFFEDEYGHINYVESDSVFSTAYQKGFTLQTPVTQVKEYHYYYDDTNYYNMHSPYYDNFSWNVSFSWGNRYYNPYRYYNYSPYYGNNHYASWYWDYPYYNSYWGHSPWYSYQHGYYWTHHYNNYGGGYWYGDNYWYNKKYNRDKRDWDRRGTNYGDRNSYTTRNNTKTSNGYTNGVSNPVNVKKPSSTNERTVIKRTNTGTEKQVPRKPSGSEVKRTRTESNDVKRNDTKNNTKSNTRVRSTNKKDTDSNLNRIPSGSTNSTRIRTQVMVKPNTSGSTISTANRTSPSRTQVVVDRSPARQNTSRESVSKSVVRRAIPVIVKSAVNRVSNPKSYVSKTADKRTTRSNSSVKSNTKSTSKSSSSTQSSSGSSYRSTSSNKSSSSGTSSRSSSGNTSSRSRRN